VVSYLRKQQKRSPALEFLEEENAEVERYQSLLKQIQELRGLQFSEDFTWPVGIPRPEATSRIAVPDKAAFDIALFAATFVFLHEFRHVQFGKDGNRPSEPHVEEIECDAYATDFIMSHVGRYCAESGEPRLSAWRKKALKQLDSLCRVTGLRPAKGLRLV
jgi:hypothetical protein